MKPNERREKLIEVLCQRRQDTTKNLASEFGVSVRTILYDIEQLSLSYPLRTIQGRYGGGVRVMDGYYLNRKYLKPKQQELLEKLGAQLDGDELAIMNSILNDFALKGA
jgi:predicted DNA-binding transcriptional regulator YafY